MTVDELTRLCKEPCVLTGKIPSHIYLTVPVARLPRGDTIRLGGRVGPKGKLCTVSEDVKGYKAVAVFKRKEILKALEG